MNVPLSEPPLAGHLILIAGCMFAGKTGRLIARLRAAAAEGRRVVALKHQLDDRYDATALSTHDGQRWAARPIGHVTGVARLAAGADVVGIDEAHFFGRALVPALRPLQAAGQDVILAGLDHDAWGQEIPPLPELRSQADEVELLTVPCGLCGRPARYSQRLVPVRAGRMVGGPAEYAPRCAACFQPLTTPAPRYDP